MKKLIAASLAATMLAGIALPGCAAIPSGHPDTYRHDGQQYDHGRSSQQYEHGRNGQQYGHDRSYGHGDHHDSHHGYSG